MVDKKTKWSIDEKVRIVLQTFNPETNMAELCREYNLIPKTVYNWKEKFVEGGRSSFTDKNSASKDKRHQKETAQLKRIIGEYAVALEALKKTLEGRKD